MLVPFGVIFMAISALNQPETEDPACRMRAIEQLLEYSESNQATNIVSASILSTSPLKTKPKVNKTSGEVSTM